MPSLVELKHFYWNRIKWNWLKSHCESCVQMMQSSVFHSIGSSPHMKTSHYFHFHLSTIADKKMWKKFTTHICSFFLVFKLSWESWINLMWLLMSHILECDCWLGAHSILSNIRWFIWIRQLNARFDLFFYDNFSLLLLLFFVVWRSK